MSRAIIATTDLCRYFRRGQHEVRAVDQISLEVSPGEFIALVGASGSGKSTLLALMAGLDSPTSGRVEFEGHSLGDMDRGRLAAYRAHQVGMVFQSFNLIPHLTAQQNVELALFFDNTPRDQRRAKATEALAQLNLSDRLDHRPADLSGGEQQRVALARALVKKPSVLFADEPTGNLDAGHSRQISDILTELNSHGMTIIMVTHDMAMAARSARRIVKLVYGRVEPEGTA
jgi:putative ABC transport system ATP-binding protein